MFLQLNDDIHEHIAFYYWKTYRQQRPAVSQFENRRSTFLQKGFLVEIIQKLTHILPNIVTILPNQIYQIIWSDIRSDMVSDLIWSDLKKGRIWSDLTRYIWSVETLGLLYRLHQIQLIFLQDNLTIFIYQKFHSEFKNITLIVKSNLYIRNFTQNSKI